MGSNLFQKEYIEYLQEKNTELTSRLNHMKEHYENKVLSRDLNKHYIMSTLQDVSHICTEIPQEIDLFFDKMAAAMDVLKNVLLRKAEMVQLVEKISKVINSTDLIAMDGSDSLKEPISEIRSGKKTGIIKVSPMINGHVISTEPRIYLNRVPELFTPVTRNGTHQLSPIIEASPDVSSDTSKIGTHNFKDIAVSVERLNLNKAFNYMAEESPKSRFKGPKTWKKSLSSTKCQSENQRNPPFSENKENINKKISFGEIENVDPLEGPSWLHNGNETRSTPTHFTEYRRRKHRYATVFDKNEEDISTYERETIKLSLKGEDTEEQDDDCDSGEGSGDNDPDENDDEDHNSLDEVECYENHKEKDDKEDFEEFRKSSNSVDLFCEPFRTELEEKISPFKKINSNKRKRRKHDDRDSVEKYSATELEKNYTFKISTYHSKIKKEKNTLIPKQLNYSNERDNEEYDCKSKKSNGKRHSKTLLEGPNSRMSFEKTSYKSECWKRSSRNSTNENNDSGVEKKGRSSIKGNLEKELFVELEDFMLNRKISASEKLKAKDRNKKKLSRSKLSNESESPKLLVESEGRKKRKAAPTFKLVEPKLKPKLRRN